MIAPKLKKVSLNLLLLCGSLLISLLTLELLVKMFLPASPEQHQLFVEYDPLLGWRKIPNMVGEHVTSEYTVSESINSKGIRGPEYSYEKAEGDYRILILGDSFAEGYSVEFEQLFSEILKSRLNQNNKDIHIEVINAGTGGYSTDQELLFFQNEGQKYNPDLTILMFFDNDVWYNNQTYYWRGHKPMFKLTNNSTLELTNVPVPKPVNDPADVNPIKGKNSLDTVKIWLDRNSSLYTFIRDRVENTPFLRAIGAKSGLVRSKLPIPGDFRIYEAHPNNDVVEAWRITEALIARLKEETISIDSEFLIFFVPARENVYPAVWNLMKEQYNISDDHWDMKQIQRTLQTICTRNNIDCITPIDSFRKKANELQADNQLMYYPEDNHWNVNGHKFAGELLTDYIIQNYLNKNDLQKYH